MRARERETSAGLRQVRLTVGMVQAILSVHRDSVGRAAGAVNQALLFRNWLIGAYTVEYEQCGEDRAAYGARLLANLAGDLRRREVAGCSAEMLGRMRSFYRALPQLRTRIPPSALGEFQRLARSSAASEISSSLMTKFGSASPIPCQPTGFLSFPGPTGLNSFSWMIRGNVRSMKMSVSTETGRYGNLPGLILSRSDFAERRSLRVRCHRYGTTAPTFARETHPESPPRVRMSTKSSCSAVMVTVSASRNTNAVSPMGTGDTRAGV